MTLFHRPFDRVESPLASLPIFSDVRPMSHISGLVDWRLNGKLSHMMEKDRIEGHAGESLMIPTQGRLNSETLVLYGLGKRNDWDPIQAESTFIPWVEKLTRLGQERWLLSFSDLTDDLLAWRNGVRAFINAIVYRKHRLRDDGSGHGYPGCRHLMLAEDAKRVLEAKKRHMDFGENVILDFDLKGE